MHQVVAAELTRHQLRTAIVREDGTLAGQGTEAVPSLQSPAAFVDFVVASLMTTIGTETVDAVCVALGGLVDSERGTIILAPEIPGVRNLPLATAISERLGIPAFVENDIRAEALAGVRFGSARGVRDLLHIRLSGHIGGGIIIGGRIYRGSAGLAGEIGHMVLDPSGPICGCGSRGCLDAMASGTALAERARQLAVLGKSAALTIKLASPPISEHDLYAAAAGGDSFCEAEIRHGGHLLGLALGGMVNALNPELVTLSGSLLEMGDMLLDPLRQAMISIARGTASQSLVQLSELGDSVLLGAAAVALELVDRP